MPGKGKYEYLPQDHFALFCAISGSFGLWLAATCLTLDQLLGMAVPTGQGNDSSQTTSNVLHVEADADSLSHYQPFQPSK